MSGVWNNACCCKNPPVPCVLGVVCDHHDDPEDFYCPGMGWSAEPVPDEFGFSAVFKNAPGPICNGDGGADANVTDIGYALLGRPDTTINGTVNGETVLLHLGISGLQNSGLAVLNDTTWNGVVVCPAGQNAGAAWGEYHPGFPDDMETVAYCYAFPTLLSDASGTLSGDVLPCGVGVTGSGQADGNFNSGSSLSISIGGPIYDSTQVTVIGSLDTTSYNLSADTYLSGKTLNDVGLLIGYGSWLPCVPSIYGHCVVTIPVLVRSRVTISVSGDLSGNGQIAQATLSSAVTLHIENTNACSALCPVVVDSASDSFIVEAGGCATFDLSAMLDVGIDVAECSISFSASIVPEP